MNKTKITKDATQIMVYLKFEHQFDNGGPRIKGKAFAIIYETKDNTWGVDSVEVTSIDEIHMMGVAITGHKEQRATIDYFKTMGISLYDEAYKVVDEIIDCSGTPERFVFDQTGIVLPKL